MTFEVFINVKLPTVRGQIDPFYLQTCLPLKNGSISQKQNLKALDM